MSTPDYTTLGVVKVFAEIPAGDTSRDDFINWMIPRISRQVDKYCHRHFYPKQATEIYDYNDEWKLWLRGDLHSMGSITNGDLTTLDPSHYFLYPLSGPPYGWIEINRSSGVTFRFGALTPQQSISISGIWGYLEDGDVPSGIVDGATTWISYLLKLGKNAGIRSKTIGDYTVSYANFVDAVKEGPPGESSYYLDHFIKRRYSSNVKNGL